MSRDQDDIEEEILFRTAWSQIRTVATYAWSGWAMKASDPVFCYHILLAMAAVVSVWILMSARFQRTVRRVFWQLGLVEGTEYIWHSKLGDDAAVFSLQGRRPNMEDRYAIQELRNDRNGELKNLISL